MIDYKRNKMKILQVATLLVIIELNCCKAAAVKGNI